MFRLVSGYFLCAKPSPLVKTEGHIQHVFRWGVGNKFRSINANRFTPVHHARPKEVTIREDYFESPNKDVIKFDTVNEQWEVFWYENNKLNAKPFPIKKFGIEQSKTEAIKFMNELVETGRYSRDLTSNENLRSDVDGVSWDDRLQSWIAFDGKGSRAFSASKHGVHGARQLAEQFITSRSVKDVKQKLDSAIKDFTKSLKKKQSLS